MNSLTDLVESTYSDLGEMSNYSVEYLSGWYLDNSNIGKLNNLIDSSFSGCVLKDSLGVVTGGYITGDLNGEEQGIFKKLFEYEYYNRQTKYALSGMAGANANDWITIKEGDSSIQRVNKNESVKTLRQLSRDARQDLEFMVMNYLKFNTSPEQVTGDDDIAGGFYGGFDHGYNGVRSYVAS